MSSSDTFLVTGASGFVGSAVARLLVERGFRVRALVRPTSPVEHLAGHDIEFIPGDLRDMPGWEVVSSRYFPLNTRLAGNLFPYNELQVVVDRTHGA